MEKQTPENPPNPGSEEARKLGCICPVMDNSHGYGYLGQKDVFVYRDDCPLHRSVVEKFK